nr:ribonuclease H-like domain-containing protein [Tanacetum cinerariifolium]
MSGSSSRKDQLNDYFIEMSGSSSRKDQLNDYFIERSGYTDVDWTGCPSTRRSTSAETTWLRNLLRELHSLLSAATLVYCDNVSATYLSANPVQHQRTKHIEIDIHFVHGLVTVGQVRVLHVPSRYQYAGIFTKGLPSALFENFRSSLSVRLPLARTAGAY